MTENTQDGQRLWRRRRDEPNLWYERFTIYRRLGPRRSLMSTINIDRARRGQEKTDQISGAWRRAFRRYEWEKRAEAWDEYSRQREEERWLARQEKIRDLEWQMSDKLIERGLQMLQFPLATTTREEKTEDGRVTVINTVKPSKWSFGDAARIFKIASELARLAAGLPTDRSEVTGKDGEPLFGSVKSMTLDQLLAIGERILREKGIELPNDEFPEDPAQA